MSPKSFPIWYYLVLLVALCYYLVLHLHVPIPSRVFSDLQNLSPGLSLRYPKITQGDFLPLGPLRTYLTCWHYVVKYGMSTKILRVFPTRTSFTPEDDLVEVGYPGLWKPRVDEVHISCLFTWQRHLCEKLKAEWSRYYRNKVKLGGPAYGLGENGFVPGRYIKKGVTFTSRGCNFNCPWCFVPKREGRFRPLKEIASGNIIQDNNVLLHFRAFLTSVFAMLRTQRAIRFVGGLDVRLLKDWHIEELRSLRIKELWLALDSFDTQKQFARAAKKLRKAGFTRHQVRSYVLAGFDEPIQEAESRLRFAYECGALPFVQLYQPPLSSKRMSGEISRDDNLFIGNWSRPAIIKTTMGPKNGT